MASDHDRPDDPGASHDGAHRRQHTDWDSDLSDDVHSLELLREEWLASDDGSNTAAILAATQPMGSAQQEQVVQRLLHDQARQRSARAPTRPPPTPAAQRLRMPLWSAAAACALCCWLAALGPLGGAAPSPQDAAAGRSDSRATLHPGQVRSTSPTREARTEADVPQAAASARGREALTDLAETYAQQQRFDEAEALFQQALTEQERRLGPAHKDVADTLTRLAALYQVQHLYAKAEPLYVRAFEIDPPFAVF